MKAKSNVKVHQGGRKAVPGPRQKEALSGRGENQKHKSNFKAGAFAATDPNAGRPNGRLIPERQNAMPGSREEQP
jgi:hypothetical protein